MGFRLQRSIKLGKFMRLNISKSGVGISAGVRGLRISSGPRGAFINLGIPGTGLSYRKKLSSGKKRTARSGQKKDVAAAQSVRFPDLPSPSFFAPRHEKDLAKALDAYRAGQTDEALEYFLDAATKEVGAAIFAAAILAEKDLKNYRAIQLLEGIVQSDDEFPTLLMEKYLATTSINVAITPNVRASVPVDGLAVTLLLVELYQAHRRVREAIGLLEEIEELVGHPALTLSLCELYASRELWAGIIDRAKNTESLDNITLEILIFYGLAMQKKGMPEAAVSIFTKALRRKKDRNPTLLNEAMYWRALSYHQLGKHSRANQELQKLYAEDPDFRDVAARLTEYSSR
jgi:tetratricopeptide (TPR) repeat protein